MEINDLIKRINDLTHKNRDNGLQPWEKAERESLRQEYLKYIRAQVESSLGTIETDSNSNEL